MQVGAAHTVVEDFDLHVMLAQRTALKAEWSKWRRGIKGGIALGIYYVRVSVGEAEGEVGGLWRSFNESISAPER